MASAERLRAEGKAQITPETEPGARDEPRQTVSAHSPAPYRPRDPLHHAELYVAKTDDLRGMESIAEVGPAMRDDEALANACLFEVAGELLDAARDLVALYGDFQPGEAYADPPEHPLSRARALILKYEDNVREGTDAWERMMAERTEAEPTVRDVRESGRLPIEVEA